jgi:hypothetical protein
MTEQDGHIYLPMGLCLAPSLPHSGNIMISKNDEAWFKEL